MIFFGDEEFWIEDLIWLVGLLLVQKGIREG